MEKLMQLSFQPPTLYKKNESGDIQLWKIWVLDYGKRALLMTVFGPEKPKRKHKTTEVHYKLDASGEPIKISPFELAKKDAQTRWEQQKGAGYSEDVEALRDRFYCPHKGITIG